MCAFFFCLKYFAASSAWHLLWALYIQLSHNLFHEAVIDSTHIPLLYALGIPLLVCLPYHTECYLFICLSLLILKLLEGRVTALLISLSPVWFPTGIAEISLIWIQLNKR